MRSVLMASAPLLIATVLAAGCGGTSEIPAPPEPTVSGSGPALPPLPSGADEVRLAQLADGVGVAGDPPFDSHNGTSEPGSTLLLAVPDPASNDTAWAVYQIPESVGDTIEAFAFDVQYLDPDPLATREHEGYWVGYSNYATGSWCLDGPFTGANARAWLPPGTDVVSPGGFYYALVLVTGANQARVNDMYYAWYTAPGYQEEWIGRPQGHSPGMYCDIQLDMNDEPHVGYFNSPYVLNRHWAGLRVAHRSGTEWIYDDISPSYTPRWSRLAVGYVGSDIQRALIAGDADSADIWLYYDDGTGFDGGQLASNSASTSVVGAVTFVNSLDDPLGDLDLAVIAFAVPDAPPTVQTKYVTYDGTVMSAEQLLYPVATSKPGRLSLTTHSDKVAIAAVPHDPGAGWECHIGTLTAGVWNFVAPAWGPLERVETGDEDVPDFVACESPGNGIVVGYVRDGRSEVMLALHDGIDYQTTANDVLPTGFQYLLDIETFSGSGRAVILDTWGQLKPMLRWGLPGSGELYGQQYIDAEPHSVINGSLDIDTSNNVHIAAYNAMTGELTYIMREPIGDPTTEVIDNGGLQLGGSAFMAWPVYVGEELHVFYVNSTHPGVLHAHNSGAIWLTEGETVASGGIPFYITGAGYLADLDLLYCGYIDFFTLGYMVASGTPGGSDWTTVQMTDVLTEMGYIGDNESEVAVIYFAPQMLAEGEMRVAYGNPREGASRTAAITLGYRRMVTPMSIAYNPVGEHWGLVTNFEGIASAHYYYEDSPGSWLGPHVIANLEGPGAEFRVNHLSYLTTNGAPRIVAGHIADGDPNFKFSIYTAAPESTSFYELDEVLSLDMLTSEIEMASAAANPDGEPAIGVMHKLLVDPDWDVELFALDGVDTWATVETWDFPVEEGAAIVGVSASNMPCAAAIEMDDTSSEYGQPVVYYYW